MTVIVNKWGHSLGLRIPKAIADRNDIGVGSELEVVETSDGLLLRKKSRRPTLQEIIDSIPDDYEMEDLIPDILPSEQW